jgi:hypothetical protein
LHRLLDKLRRPPAKDSRLDITIAAYRQTFRRDEVSKRVYLWLLERCGIFKRIDTEEQRVLHNWGIELMENMGLTQGLNFDALVDAMLRFGIPKEAVDSDESQEGIIG